MRVEQVYTKETCATFGCKKKATRIINDRTYMCTECARKFKENYRK